MSTHTTIEHLFSNRTWSLGNQDLVSKQILDEWTTPTTDFYLHLVLYIGMLFWTSALASTIPIPSGLFIPVLKMGAAYGRLIGELMHSAFPEGIKYGDYVHPSSIVPGSYAVVGAAALSGAVTHTISTSVILFEMTGQIVHIIPVILGVLIANAVCQSLQPSIYDSIIEIKKLPYLPPIASSNSVSHKIVVKDFMNTNLAYIWRDKCTYGDLKTLLAAHKKIISFPLVESPKSKKLLGSVPRPDLLKLLYLHLGRERRLQEVCRRNSDTLAPALLKLNADGKSALAAVNNSVGDISADRGLEFRLNSSSSSSSSSEASDSGSTASSCDSNVSKQCSVKAKGSNLKLCRNSATPILDSAYLAANYGTTNGDLTDDTSINGCIMSSQTSGHHDESSSDTIDEVTPLPCVAKEINHYNRGTSMDEEQLDKSIQEFRNHLEAVNEILDVVVVPPTPVRPPSCNSMIVNQTTMSNEEQTLRFGTPFCNTIDSSKLNRPLSPVAELRPTSSFSYNPQNPSLNSKPTKSILKTSSTTASFSNMYKRNISSQSFASTVDGKGGPPSEGRLSAMLGGYGDGTFTVGGGGHCSSFELEPVRRRRKVTLPRLRVVDMTPEEQAQWEKEQLNAYIDVSKCQVDEAPFQLVEQTSLYRVHTLFSMLGLNHAYVTSFGRLVGIVALKDIRYAIEKMLQEK